MDILQQALDHELEELPRRFLETLLLKKIRAAGITATKTLSHELARHILSGNNEPSTYRDGRSNREHITITVEEDDIKEIVSKLDSFGETQLDRLIETVADPIVTRLLKTLKSGWADEYIFQQAELSAFRARLENRWGIPLSQLRMLLTISREWCQETCNHDTNLKIDNKIHLNDLLVRQLVRASQVADEIICFLENGFADGAMARWRTLHETAIVASVISQHGEDIVERYIAHEAVESKRALEKYDNCHEQLGYKPISEGERKTIIKSYEAAIARYGDNFKGDYGWAAEHLKKKRPTFADLEAEADRAEMRIHYQMGNDNIHAGVKSIFVRLGLLENYNDQLLGGRSNVGLVEAGQNAAHTLTQISILVCASKGNLDDLVIGRVMMGLRDQILQSFAQADRKLRRDERKHKKLMAQPSQPEA